MRILVIEDTLENIEAAKEQLKEHELTVATSVKEAYMILWGQNSTHNPKVPFDVVLTDLYLPAPDEPFQGWAFYPTDNSPAVDSYRLGDLMPAGLVFAIVASQQGSKVGILTDTDHHKDQVVALLDLVTGETGNRQPPKKTMFCPDGRNYVMATKNWDQFLAALMKWYETV